MLPRLESGSSGSARGFLGPWLHRKQKFSTVVFLYPVSTTSRQSGPLSCNGGRVGPARLPPEVGQRASASHCLGPLLILALVLGGCPRAPDGTDSPPRDSVSAWQHALSESQKPELAAGYEEWIRLDPQSQYGAQARARLSQAYIQ